MAYFTDQIKNVSKTFVIKLYEIAKQYSFMSLTRVEESIGLSPITYEQELLGSRGSQGDFRREPAPDEATKTQTATNFPSPLTAPTLRKHKSASVQVRCAPMKIAGITLKLSRSLRQAEGFGINAYNF